MLVICSVYLPIILLFIHLLMLTRRLIDHGKTLSALCISICCLTECFFLCWAYACVLFWIVILNDYSLNLTICCRIFFTFFFTICFTICFHISCFSLYFLLTNCLFVCFYVFRSSLESFDVEQFWQPLRVQCQDQPQSRVPGLRTGTHPQTEATRSGRWNRWPQRPRDWTEVRQRDPQRPKEIGQRY